jgi:site-specific DNA-adenine methylase
LYGRSSSYRLIEIQARRNINSKASRRGPVKELLILNYDSEGDFL